MKHSNIKLAMLPCFAGVLGGIAFSLPVRPAPAAPFFERTTASQCVYKYTTNAWHRYAVGSGVAAQVDFVQNEVGYFLCPVPDKSAIPATAISNVQVYVRNQNDDGCGTASCQFVARACSVSPGGSATCSAGVYTSGSTGFKTITLTGSSLNAFDTYAIPYLYMSVPPLDSAPSSLIGLNYSRD